MTKQQNITAFFGGHTKRAESPSRPRATLSLKRLRRSSNGSSFQSCPLCGTSFPWHKLEDHAANCNGEVQSQSGSNVTKSRPYSEPVPGLFVFEDFVTPEDEALILAELDGQNKEHKDEYLPWVPSTINGKHMGKRWGAHCTLFGLKSSHQKGALPHFVRDLLLDKLAGLAPMKGIVPDEANAIDYRKDEGHYLKAHVDDRKLAEEPIANISLAGDCFMTFTNIAASRNTAVAEKRVLLKRRCLQVMTGKARYDFTHAIHHADLLSPRRVSVTMRRATAPPSIQQQQPSVAAQPSWWSKQQQLSQPSHRIPSVSEPIPGLFLFEDFLTMEEEALILTDLDKPNDRQEWTRERHTGTHYEKRFGIDHDLWSKHLRPAANPMPHWFDHIIWPKLKDVVSMQSCRPNEMNVIEYRSCRGDYLKSHMDDRVKYKEPIANLSLAGDCYMVFGKERDPSFPKRRILLKRRMLQVLTGKARYEWTHGIEACDILSERRVSVTMREMVGKV